MIVLVVPHKRCKECCTAQAAREVGRAWLRGGLPALVPQPSRCVFAAACGLATVRQRCAECQMQDRARQNGLKSPRSRENSGVRIMLFEHDFDRKRFDNWPRRGQLFSTVVAWRL